MQDGPLKGLRALDCYIQFGIQFWIRLDTFGYCVLDTFGYFCSSFGYVWILILDTRTQFWIRGSFGYALEKTKGFCKYPKMDVFWIRSEIAREVLTFPCDFGYEYPKRVTPVL